MTGFVYAVRCGEFVKIGYSAKPELRAVKINSDNPMPCQLVGFYEATRQEEAEIHRRLKRHHSHSEWFRAEGDVLPFLASLPPALPRRRRYPRRPFADWIHKAGLTHAQVASDLGIPGSDLARVTIGDSGHLPSPELVAKIEALTGGLITAEDHLAAIRISEEARRAYAERQAQRILGARMTGQEIRDLREALEWKQHQLAEYLGTTQATVSRIETGEWEPSGPMVKLLQLLDENRAEHAA